MLSQAPQVGRSDAGVDASSIAEEAKFFVECRLLDRDVEITLVDHNGQNLVGQIRHEVVNILVFAHDLEFVSSQCNIFPYRKETLPRH